jgi:hypothetical protein
LQLPSMTNRYRGQCVWMLESGVGYFFQRIQNSNLYYERGLNETLDGDFRLNQRAIK